MTCKKHVWHDKKWGNLATIFKKNMLHFMYLNNQHDYNSIQCAQHLYTNKNTSLKLACVHRMLMPPFLHCVLQTVTILTKGVSRNMSVSWLSTSACESVTDEQADNRNVIPVCQFSYAGSSKLLPQKFFSRNTFHHAYRHMMSGQTVQVLTKSATNK